MARQKAFTASSGSWLPLPLPAPPSPLCLYGKRALVACGVPLVRVGFPVVDRPLAYTEPVAGYEGALSLLRRVANAFCEEEERGVDPEDLTISRYF